VLLGLSYAVSGGSILVAKILQLLLGAVTCALTWRTGRRLFGPRAGLVAGLVGALYGPMIFFETELLATGWACFFAIVLLDRFSGGTGSGPRSWWITGLLSGLATLIRPTFLPAVLVAAVFVLTRAPRSIRIRCAVLAALGFAVCAVPVALLGAGAVGHASILPASGPMNLYLGNHHEPCRTLTVRPGEEWTELALMARPEKAGDLRANREYFRERLTEEVTSHPGAVLAGMLRKSLQVISSRELPRNVDPYFAREFSPLLSVLMFRIGGFGFPMGVVLPFAVWGAWTGRRRIPAGFAAFLVTYLLAIVLVFVSARYRMPLVPGLSILAGVGVVAFGEALRARRTRELAAAGSVVLGVAAISILPGPFCEEEIDYRAETLYAVGYSLHAAGDLEAAADAYARALSRRADYPELLNQFALLRSQQGRRADAIRYWSRAAQLDPGNLAVRLNLARSLSLVERHDEALAQYEAALRIDPGQPDALLGSGFALLGIARFEQGVTRLEQALDRRPAFADRMPPVIEALRGRGRDDLARRLEQRISGLRR
jgi:tetratricopeptide (TPR) repeat protein